MIGRIIGLLISAAILALGYKIYSDHKTPAYSNPTNTIQNTKDTIQKRLNQ